MTGEAQVDQRPTKASQAARLGRTRERETQGRQKDDRPHGRPGLATLRRGALGQDKRDEALARRFGHAVLVDCFELTGVFTGVLTAARRAAKSGEELDEVALFDLAGRTLDAATGQAVAARLGATAPPSIELGDALDGGVWRTRRRGAQWMLKRP
ncbi:MAG: hypothetical protein FKY71_10550 [Spiribacter salinus]|uniref:Uncharacterized protein n=1 Tax=Spiribacter salinus TaxID=1335746 RepID=A0A540VQL4_9GAMM|nr:MAG: hypothetical protein FKY71_10550 [Spiribacter salinus]